MGLEAGLVEDVVEGVVEGVVDEAEIGEHGVEHGVDEAAEGEPNGVDEDLVADEAEARVGVQEEVVDLSEDHDSDISMLRILCSAIDSLLSRLPQLRL